jgi:hypothetical protein
MMRIKNIMLIATLLPGFALADCALTNGGLASPTGNSFNGPTACAGGSSSHVSVNGPLRAQNTKIDSVAVNGPFEIKDSSIGASSVAGSIDAKNARLGKVTVSGSIKAENSDIEDITLTGSAHLSHVNIDNIIASGNSNCENGSRIYLNDHSVVSGNISFTNGHAGKVFVSNDSKILGKVYGGSVEHQ